MAKLALFLPNLLGGGAERCFVNLARALSNRGHAVDLVVSNKSGPYVDEVPASVRLVNLDVAVPLLSFGKLAGYLRRERPAILYSALNQANVAAIVASKLCSEHVPVAIGVHNSLSLEAKNAAGINLKMMPYFVKTFYPLADSIVAVSDGVADDLAAFTGIGRGRISVIYNPVVSDQLFEEASEPINHPWFTSETTPVVLAVGRLNIQKDYATLLKAFRLLRSRMPARLLILGEGDERGSLERTISELNLTDSVSMPGFVRNPFAYMGRSAVLAMSSIYEGLPTVLIEALALGCPIVSTDCKSGPREILADGKYGDLVAVGDAEALASALERTINKPRQSKSHDSWAPYGLAASAQRYEALIDKGASQTLALDRTKG